MPVSFRTEWQEKDDPKNSLKYSLKDPPKESLKDPPKDTPKNPKVPVPHEHRRPLRHFHWSAFLVLIVITALAVWGLASVYRIAYAVPSEVGPWSSTHEHADFKVYIDGKAVDYSQEKYQDRIKYVHVENGIGDVVHTHATGVKLYYFFQTLGGFFDNNCIRPAFDWETFCNNATAGKTLKFFVKYPSTQVWTPAVDFGQHTIRDLEKYLISYGNESEAELMAQMDSVTDLAWRESRKQRSPY